MKLNWKFQLNPITVSKCNTEQANLLHSLKIVHLCGVVNKYIHVVKHSLKYLAEDVQCI